MSKQLFEKEKSIDSLEQSKDNCLKFLEETTRMFKELKGDLFPAITNDYKTKRDASN